MKRKWGRSSREPILVTRSHCATGVGRGTKGLLALMPTRMLGVTCGLLGHPDRDGGREVGAMRQLGRAERLAAASALLLVLGACSDGSDEPGNDPTATSTTTSPTPTDTATPPTESELASRAATELLQKYYAIRNELRQDPATPLRRLRSVSISTDLAAQEAFLRTQRKEGLRQVGDTHIADLTVESVTLDNSDPKAGRVPTVVVDVCYDVTDVDIVDADGKSVVPDDRPDRGWVRHSVSNYEWETDRSRAWRVATSENLEQPPCDAP